MIGAAELALMKPEAIIVNTSRGPVIDETALTRALADNKLFGAGLDVFDQEPPPPDNPLFKLNNVLLTSHFAGPTWDNHVARFRNAFDNVQRVRAARSRSGWCRSWPNSRNNSEKRGPHERRRGRRRNPQARGHGVPVLLSAQSADRGLRRARHPPDPVPAGARRRRHGRRLYAASSAARRTACSRRRPAPASRTRFPASPRPIAENVPMLIIPAGLPLARQYVRPVFRAAEVYRPVTKWSALAHSVQELPDLMRRAYHAMRSGKGGPVLVEVPDEVFEAEFKGELDYTPVPVQRAAPDPDAVQARPRRCCWRRRTR